MSTKVILSLIVPIYGVEAFLPRFLESLTPNLGDSMEVILVDDGSKDNAPSMIDEYAYHHADCVRVVHKENGGLSSARNAGLKVACGEYVIFPDPDDYIAPDYVSSILRMAEKYEYPDMIIFDYEVHSKKGIKRNTISAFSDGIVSKELFLTELLKDRDLQSMVWFKAIKRSFFEGRFFDETVRVSEDALLLTDLSLDLKRIAYERKVLYFYQMREGSLVKSVNLDDAVRMFYTFKERYDKYKDLISKPSQAVVIRMAHSVLVQAAIRNIDNEGVEACRSYIINNMKSILWSMDMHIQLKKRSLFVL